MLYFSVDKHTNAELAYTEWETDLHFQIENAENDYLGFDEYIYEIGEIGHDPFELLAYLTVMYNNYLFSEIEGDLRALFDEQYTLTFTETVETRYYTDDDGEEVPYDWHILTIKLDVKPLGEIIDSLMDDEQRGRHQTLMDTKGGRQYAGSPFAFNWLPNVTSHYGWRSDPFTNVKAFHTGIDIGVPIGTPIIAAHDGIISAAVWGTDGYGRYIRIEGKNGLSTLYAHCDTLLVSVGVEVKQGDVIATSGNTGNSTGPHLHYEVIFGGEYLNPLFFASTNFEE